MLLFVYLLVWILVCVGHVPAVQRYLGGVELSSENLFLGFFLDHQFLKLRLVVLLDISEEMVEFSVGGLVRSDGLNHISKSCIVGQ